MKTHISLENLITFLLTTPMFEDLDPAEIREIVHIVETNKYAPGEVVFSEGDTGDAWYALYRGEVEVIKTTANAEQPIRKLEPPACFGEVAILDGLPRSATVRATQESTVLRVPRDALQKLLDEDHLVAYKLIKYMALTLVHELRSNTEKIAKLLEANQIDQVFDGLRTIVDKTTFRD